MFLLDSELQGLVNLPFTQKSCPDLGFDRSCFLGDFLGFLKTCQKKSE